MWLIDLLILPRSARELARLNRIHNAFNEGRLTSAQARSAIYMHKWKYHHNKVNLLIELTHLLNKK